MTFIKADSIRKSYGRNKVLEDISFEIQEGRFYTILGLNGTGKSTLLNILSGRTSKDKSSGTILGVPLGEDIAEDRERVGYVSEKLALGIGITIKKLISIYSLFHKRWDQEYFDFLIQQRKLDINKDYNDMSRGQKMQFFLCVMLAKSPDLMFVDEVTSVLDYKARTFFLEELNKIKLRGGTVVLTTNIITEVNTETTDLIIIKDRECLYEGPKSELFKRFVKLRDLESESVPSAEGMLYLGDDAMGRNHYLARTEEINESFDKFILKDGANLGEVFMLLTEGPSP